jgi:ATP-dependent Lon protease
MADKKKYPLEVSVDQSEEEISSDEKESGVAQKIAQFEERDFSVLPLRDVVVFPYMVIPLFVGRKKSVYALESAMLNDKLIVLLAQKDAAVEAPSTKDLYRIGTLAKVLQLLKLPDGTIKVLVEGMQKVKVKKFGLKKTFFAGTFVSLDDNVEETGKGDALAREQEVLVRTVKTQFEQYVKSNKKIPPEVITNIETVTNHCRLVDLIAAHLLVPIEVKQKILEMRCLHERLQTLISTIERELDLINIERKIQGRVQKQMAKSQREYYLNEQIKAIHLELGDGESPNDMEQLKGKIEKAGMSKEAKEKAMSEFTKLKLMPPMSAEATVSRNYLECLIDLPWKKKTRLQHTLEDAEKILDEEHYGLDKVKERIIEYLAVQKRVKKLKGPILCLVGPPGVGKTSLGQSIAHAIGRKYVRMSLGGVRDEAEIRGHRRTYIGAMPGKIIQKITKTEVTNPFFLLDEVDKMAMDFRGDPAAALLEVLDPEQNSSFNDHYLEVDYDLSDVMFVATANTMDIPPALLDRMEIIRLSGYTEDEKSHIAMRHLIPKQLEQNGLKASEIKIPESVVIDIIRYYTREAGVRGLERDLAKLCRKVVRQILSDKKLKTVSLTSKKLEKYLGVKRYRYGSAEEENRIGQVTGLAWTEVGGELLHLESAVMPGKGAAVYTGQLGDVMQESIQAAMTVVRSRSEILGIPKTFFEKHDFHIHAPEGATPKDGPSAGIGMCTALLSAIIGLPVNSEVAMTGEITLRGEVLPIGGLKEKLLAAHRGLIKTVLIPYENEKDLQEIPEKVKKELTIIPVKWIDEVLTHAILGYTEHLLAVSKGKSPLMLAEKKTKRSKVSSAH